MPISTVLHGWKKPRAGLFRSAQACETAAGPGAHSRPTAQSHQAAPQRNEQVHPQVKTGRGQVTELLFNLLLFACNGNAGPGKRFKAGTFAKQIG